MPFLDSLDIAKRACQHCGVGEILTVDEDSLANREISNAYDKLRRAELQRNDWRFSIRKAALRALDTTTLELVPAAFDATRTYLPGEIVKDGNGLLWISLAADNLNNTPGSSNDAWDMYFGPLTASLWLDGTSYVAGELVYVITGTTPNGYQVYLSLISSNTDTPGTATAWDTDTQYKQDQVVSHAGSQWRSLLPANLGNTPADGANAWVEGTAYTLGNQVTGSDNYIYTATGSTTGNDPTTDGGVHWTNTGNLNAWSRTPVLLASSINWRPIRATLQNIMTIYPIGTGPASQVSTRNIFRLPAGFLKKAPQSPKIPVAALGGPRGIVDDDWQLDGNYIVTDQSGVIILRFVADVTKVASMNDMFCEGLAVRVAEEVVTRLTNSDAKLQTLASKYKYFMGEARQANAIEQGPVDPPDDEFLAVRY